MAYGLNIYVLNRASGERGDEAHRPTHITAAQTRKVSSIMAMLARLVRVRHCDLSALVVEASSARASRSNYQFARNPVQ